jgi:hypothetical protein
LLVSDAGQPADHQARPDRTDRRGHGTQTFLSVVAQHPGEDTARRALRNGSEVHKKAVTAALAAA